MVVLTPRYDSWMLASMCRTMHRGLRTIGSIAFGVLAVPVRANTQAIRIEPVVRIGCALCDGPELLSKVSALAVTTGGTVVVGDDGDRPIRKFNSAGRPIWAGGRKGQGPGEVGHASYLSAREDGSWDLVDLALSRRSWFDAAGKLVRTAPLPGLTVAVSYGGSARAMHLATAGMGDNAVKIFLWPDDSVSPRQVLSDLRFPVDSANQQILSFPLVTLPQSGFSVGDPYGYRIRVFDERGAARMDLVRTVPRRRKTAEEITEDQRVVAGRKAAVMSRAGQGASAAALPRVDPLRTHFSNQGLAYDDRGRLWVLAGRSEGLTSILDVFSADGKFISEIRLPVSVRRIALRGSYLAGLEIDPEGVEFVRLWRVTDAGRTP